MEQTAPVKRPLWTTWLFVGLPVWLALSAAGAIWWHLKKAPDSGAGREERRFVRTISAEQVGDDLQKLRDYLGGRSPESKNLPRTAAWIEGTLGPSNTGYQVTRIGGPSGAPLLSVEVPGANKENAIWIVTAYDSGSDSALAGLLAIAGQLAGDELRRPVHILFLPEGNATPDGTTISSAAALIRQKASPAHVLVMTSLGGPESLRVSGYGSLPPASALLDLASVDDPSPDGSGLARSLAAAGLPAVEIFSGPAVSAPSADSVARHASAVVELVRRLANQP